MPELPDVALYCEALERFVGGEVLERVRLTSPFVLRSVDPPISAVAGKRLTGTRRIGKRIVLELEGDLFVVIHLMIAGRLRWRPPGAKVPRKRGCRSKTTPSSDRSLTRGSSRGSATPIPMRFSTAPVFRQ